MSPGKSLTLATGNPGKLGELRALFGAGGWELLLPPPGYESPEESGQTYADNALIKARAAAAHSGGAALGDDSGIEVDGLDGAPGVFSARYAGPNPADGENTAKLLRELRPGASRKARFRCVLAYVDGPDCTQPLLAEGIWPGVIAPRPMGQHGFGYDPVFLLPGWGCTAAQMGTDWKNRISHRARAARALLRQLRAA